MRRLISALSVVIVAGSIGFAPRQSVAADPAAKPALSSAQSEMAMRNALQQKISVDFVETPLSDVIAFLSDKSGVQMILDRKAVGDGGLSTDFPISLKIKDISLKSALALVLEQADGLTWTIRHEVLQITTLDRANTTMATTTYILNDLLGPELAKEYDAGKLATVVMTHVAPESWQSNGGNGAINYAGMENPVLIVSQTWQNHEAIAELMSQLQAAHKPKLVRVPALPVTPPPAIPPAETPN